MHLMTSPEQIIIDSNREFDDNQFLFVADCPITAEQVNDYRGDEIKDWQNFKLDPNKMYGVYRPLEEIEKAKDTYNNLIVTDDHVPITPERPARERWLGLVSNNATVKGDGRLYNDIRLFVGKGIEDITAADLDPNNGKKELSCGYSYDIVPEQGTFNGKPYDFKMINLRGNHVALVKKARVEGSMIVDSKPSFFTKDWAKKILDVARKALAKDEGEFEEAESDRIDKILAAAAELQTIQEQEGIHSANDGINFKKETNVSKKSGLSILVDSFLGRDAKEDDKMKDAKGNMAIIKGMKDVAAKDAKEFEGGADEKAKTLMDLASKLNDAEPDDEDEPKAKDGFEPKAKESIAQGTTKEVAAGNEKASDEKDEEKDCNDKANDSMALDNLVAEKVSQALKVHHAVNALFQKAIGNIPEMLVDAAPEVKIDYILDKSGYAVTGKSLDTKIEMAKMIADKKPDFQVAMDSAPSGKSVDFFNIMKGK